MKRKRNPLFTKLALTAAILAALQGCTATTNTASLNPFQSSSPNQAEQPAVDQGGVELTASVSAMRNYRSCIDEAWEFDSQAQQVGAEGKLLLSARRFESCEADIGTSKREMAQQERMSNYAMAVLNYLKGGDVKQASTILADFQQRFPGKDLYLKDGASFVESVGLLVDQEQRGGANLVLANVPEAMKADMGRVHYWTHR